MITNIQKLSQDSERVSNLFKVTQAASDRVEMHATVCITSKSKL